MTTRILLVALAILGMCLLACVNEIDMDEVVEAYPTMTPWWEVTPVVATPGGQE